MSDPIRALESLRQQFEQDLASAGTEADLRSLRDKYLSRKGGLVSVWLKSLGSAPADERPRLGQLANATKDHIDSVLTARIEAAAQARPPKGAVDVTLPGRAPAIGHRHPLSLLRERIEAIFTRLGFLVIEGPELEDDYHNFEALNMPAEHPARDMQDTLYLKEPWQQFGGPPRHDARSVRGGGPSAAHDPPAVPTRGTTTRSPPRRASPAARLSTFPSWRWKGRPRRQPLPTRQARYRSARDRRR